MFQPDVVVSLGKNIGMVLPLPQHDLDSPGRATSVALSAYLILHFESEVGKLSGHSFDLMMVINKTIYYLIATQPPGEARLNTDVSICSQYAVDIGIPLGSTQNGHENMEAV